MMLLKSCFRVSGNGNSQLQHDVVIKKLEKDVESSDSGSSINMSR